MLLSVAKDIDGHAGFYPLDIDAIIFLEFDSTVNRIYIHTLHEQYYAMGTLKFYVQALKNSGFHFEKVDRNNAVHLPKITKLDQTYKIAYFEDEIRSNSKRCTIARDNFNDVITILKQLNRPVVII
jgi:DNA-binding LytR/AlgR family response regulator